MFCRPVRASGDADVVSLCHDRVGGGSYPSKARREGDSPRWWSSPSSSSGGHQVPSDRSGEESCRERGSCEVLVGCSGGGTMEQQGQAPRSRSVESVRQLY